MSDKKDFWKQVLITTLGGIGTALLLRYLRDEQNISFGRLKLNRKQRRI